jgi:DNA-binding NarL/FixJ family response regulator
VTELVLDAHVYTSRALTRRQREVLTHVANGHTNAQIGTLLGLHPRTVNRHLADTYKTLGARDRANAVALALLAGDLDRDDINPPADRSST